MANTFIPNLPNGTESGDFISLDLGTTNFRVILSQLRPESENKFFVKHYTVPNEFRRGKSKNVSKTLNPSPIELKFINDFLTFVTFVKK